MKKIILTIVICIVALCDVNAQNTASKPVLNHGVYDNWKSISNIKIDDKTQTLLYTIKPQEGDNIFVVYNIKKAKEQRFDRLSRTMLSSNGDVLVGLIKPTFQQIRQAKINKEKKRSNAEAPKDTLAIINLKTGDIKKFPNLKTLSTPDVLNDYIAFMLTPDKKADEKKKGDDTLKQKTETLKNNKVAQKDIQDNLYVMNVLSGKIDTIKQVEKFTTLRNGTISYITKLPKQDKGKALKTGSDTTRIEKRALTKTDKREDLDTMKFSLYLYEPATKSRRELISGRKGAKINLPIRNTKTGYYAFLAQLDTAEKANNFALYLYKGDGGVVKVADNTSSGIPEGWIINENKKPTFSKSGDRIFFGTSPKPAEKDSTDYNFERAQLDIWSWDADYNQPMQLINLKRDLNKTYQAYINVNNVGNNIKVHQLADDNLEKIEIVTDNGDGEYIIASDDRKYRLQRQWDLETLADYYIVNMKTGEKKLIAEKSLLSINGNTSENGKWAVAYDYADSCWYSINMTNGKTKNITKDIPVNFYKESHDTPIRPDAYRGVTFLSDNTVLIPDKYDLWKIDLEGNKSPVNFTNGEGRKNERELRIAPYQRDTAEFRSRSVDLSKPIYIKSYNFKNKKYGYYLLINAEKIQGQPISEKNRHKEKYQGKLQLLTEQPNYFVQTEISNGHKPIIAYSKGNFESGANLWVTTDNFAKEKQITDINPQQRDYNWGTVELFKWKTEDGIDAEGLLFKPENFDSSKKYPVMIYFYEKYSETMYFPRVPAPSRSTVNIPMFVSNGYIVFVPDLYYTNGHPGQSAMKSLMPAVKKLEEEYSWIDGSKMAIQGQSWGGYQVAYIITQTDKFAAAGAGAPVSNMTSAYGGMRWGTGMTRQFQYEQTQSRIGKNLWDGFDLYVENSPLFFVPNVTTPVLIMHNDKDEAVPWYQGIEFFTGLRRLGKKAWLLQYNNESHNLSERRNAKDLSIRLQQFFDHYLKGAPAPVWMTSHGRPAVDKDYTMLYELEK